jgi:signal transduction histidine kinase
LKIPVNQKILLVTVLACLTLVAMLGLIVQLQVHDSLSLDWVFEQDNQKAIRLGVAVTLGLIAILAVSINHLSRTPITALRTMQDDRSEQATAVNVKRQLTSYSARELERKAATLRANIDRLGIKNASESESARQGLQASIYSDLSKLEQLSADLKSIAQDNKELPTQHLDNVDFPELLAGTLSAFYPQFNARGAQVAMKRCGTSIVRANEKRLQQVLNILIHAALESIQENDEVTLHCERTVVAVSLRLHHSHYQCLEEDLGLCKSIIDLYQGFLSAHVSSDGGMEIVIMLPLQKTA